MQRPEPGHASTPPQPPVVFAKLDIINALPAPRRFTVLKRYEVPPR
jgi:hypothetical protein